MYIQHLTGPATIWRMNASPEPTDQERLIAQFYRSSRAERKRNCCFVSFRYPQSYREKIGVILEIPRDITVNSGDYHVGQQSHPQPVIILKSTSGMPPAQTPARLPATTASTASLTGSHKTKTVQPGNASSAGQVYATPPPTKAVQSADALNFPAEDKDKCWPRTRIVALTESLKNELDNNVALRGELKAAHKRVAGLEMENVMLRKRDSEVQKYRDSIAQIRKTVSGFD